MTIDTRETETPARAATSASVARRSGAAPDESATRSSVTAQPRTFYQFALTSELRRPYSDPTYNVLGLSSEGIAVSGVRGHRPVGMALIGSGRMGSFHGETLAHRLQGVRLVAVADPAPGAAAAWPASWGLHRPIPTMAGVRRPGGGCGGDRGTGPVPRGIDRGGRTAGKAIFCEKPASLTLADLDPALAAVQDAGVILQVGFNRRFAPDWAAARQLLDDGVLGTPRLVRSVTRDPGGFDPSRVAPDTIFNGTLIHDFDTLRFLNPGAEAVQVYAVADALVEPSWRDRGLSDTAVVTVRFDNGAVGVAEACFEAAYGYDVRGEVFGSGGMATMGDGRVTGMVYSGPAGRTMEMSRSDQGLLAGAYVDELAAFADAIRGLDPAPVGGKDARAALAIALAAAQSVRVGRPDSLRRSTSDRPNDRASPARTTIQTRFDWPCRRR